MRPDHSHWPYLWVLPRWRTTGATGKRQASQSNRTGAPAAAQYRLDVLTAELRVLTSLVKSYSKIVLFRIELTQNKDMSGGPCPAVVNHLRNRPLRRTVDLALRESGGQFAHNNHDITRPLPNDNKFVDRELDTFPIQLRQGITTLYLRQTAPLHKLPH